jgi:hypothetical protein
MSIKGSRLLFALFLGAGLAGAAEARAWTHTQTTAGFGVSTSGSGVQQTATKTYAFPSSSGTDVNGHTWEMTAVNATSIELLANVSSGGSASVTDCLVTSSGQACDTPASSSGTGNVTATITLTGSSEWAGNTTMNSWPSIQVSIKSGTAANSSTVAYGTLVTGS